MTHGCQDLRPRQGVSSLLLALALALAAHAAGVGAGGRSRWRAGRRWRDARARGRGRDGRWTANTRIGCVVMPQRNLRTSSARRTTRRTAGAHACVHSKAAPCPVVRTAAGLAAARGRRSSLSRRASTRVYTNAAQLKLRVGPAPGHCGGGHRAHVSTRTQGATHAAQPRTSLSS